MKNDQVARDALTAWESLRALGGIEPEGRDRELVDQIRTQIDPSATDLESALESCTTDEFLQALFGSIQPFSLMFRDILLFFQNADATQGKHQWRVQLEEVPLDLGHFEQFIRHWQRIRVPLDVPALGASDAFVLNDVRLSFGMSYLTDQPPLPNSLGDIDRWISLFDESGQYADLPMSLAPRVA